MIPDLKTLALTKDKTKRFFQVEFQRFPTQQNESVPNNKDHKSIELLSLIPEKQRLGKLNVDSHSLTLPEKTDECKVNLRSEYVQIFLFLLFQRQYIKDMKSPLSRHCV